MDEFLVTVAALDPARFRWDDQPDARMTQSAFAAIARNARGADDLCFRGLEGHVCVLVSGWASGIRAHDNNPQRVDKSLVERRNAFCKSALLSRQTDARHRRYRAPVFR